MNSISSHSLPPAPRDSSPLQEGERPAAGPSGASEGKSALKKIADYFEPREDTSGDLPYSSPKTAAVSGGIKGFFTSGAVGAAAGAAGGYAGVRVGEETGSMAKALSAGAVVGAGTLVAGTSVAAAAVTGAGLGAAALTGSSALAGAVGGGVGAAVKHVQAGKDISPVAKTLTPIALGAAAGAAAGALGGPVGAAAGAVIGGVSAAVSKPVPDESNPAKSAVLSAVVSAGAGAVTGGALAAATSGSPALAGSAVGATALMGGLTGASAVISGSRTAEVRDGSTAGFAASAITGAFTGVGGGAVNMAASIGGAVGARFEHTAGKILAAGATGGAIGAAGGAFAGPAGMVIGAAAGAGTAIAGAIAGPKVQQAVRNLTADVQKAMQPFSEKVSGFIIDKLGEEKGLAAVGAITGAIGSIPAGMLAGAILGPVGAAAAVVTSAVMGGVKFAGIAKDIAGGKAVAAELAANGPSIEDINDYMCRAAFAKIEPQLAGASDAEKAAFFNDLKTQSLAELKTKEKELSAMSKQLGNAIYADLKEQMSGIKDKDERRKFIAEQIFQARPGLTKVMAEGIVASLSAQGEGQN